MNRRARSTTGAGGRSRPRWVKPAGRRVAPGSGAPPLLPRAHPLLIHKPGCKTLVTQVFVDEDEHLESDVVFGVTRALVGGYRRHDGVAAPEGSTDGPWYSLRYGFTM